MKSNKIFEIGSIIIADKDTTNSDIQLTLDSIKNQTVISRKIYVLSSLSEDKKIKLSKDWVVKTNIELKEMGVQEFKFFDVCVKSSLRDRICHIFKEGIFRPIPITIHGDAGDKKGKLQLTHFATIKAGNEYENSRYFETVRDMFLSDKKAFVLYSNRILRDSKEQNKVNITDLNDQSSVVYHTFGFDFFINSRKDSLKIMDTYREIRKDRMAAKKEDEQVNEIDYNSSYQDIVFAKVGVNTIE